MPSTQRPCKMTAAAQSSQMSPNPSSPQTWHCRLPDDAVVGMVSDRTCHGIPRFSIIRNALAISLSLLDSHRPRTGIRIRNRMDPDTIPPVFSAAAGHMPLSGQKIPFQWPAQSGRTQREEAPTAMDLTSRNRVETTLLAAIALLAMSQDYGLKRGVHAQSPWTNTAGEHT